MKQKLYFLCVTLFFQIALFAQTQTLPYSNSSTGAGILETNLSNFSTCQVSVSATFSASTYLGNNQWTGTGTYDYYVNDNKVGSGSDLTTVDLSAYMPVTSVKVIRKDYQNWGAISLTVNITSYTSNMPQAPIVTDKFLCQNSIVTPITTPLSDTGTVLKWYTSDQGTAYSAIGPAPSTSSLGKTSYWVAQANASGCESLRSKIDVTIVGIPTVSSPVNYNQGDNATALTATMSGTTLLWYTTSMGGTGSSSALIPDTSITGNTTYWVSGTSNPECRVPIVVTVFPKAPTTSFATQVFTGNDKTLNDLQIAGTNIKWYTASTAGTLLPNSTALADGTTYYATQTISDNESKTRLAVKVKRISDATQNLCSIPNSTIASLVSTPSNGATATWYIDAVGGVALENTTVLASGSYYVEQTASNRVLVNVSLITLAKPTVNSPVVYYVGDEIPTNLLIASGGTGYNLYEFETGGQGFPVTTIPLGNSSPFSTTLWVTSTNAIGCESAREPISITLKAIEAPTTLYLTQIFTGNDKTLDNIIITGTNIKWYDAATDGTLLPSKTSLVDGTTYYATQSRNGYESETRLAITMKRISENSQLFAPNANPTLANLVSTPSSGASVKWFSTANGTTALSSDTTLSSGTYYVEQTNPAVVQTFATGINSSETSVFSVAAQTDGKIVFGDGWGRLYRMNADGSNRTTIKEGLGIGDLITQSNGTILMAGNNAVSRINTDGSVVTLNSNLAFPEGIAVQADGKILIADYQLLEAGNVKRMNADGSGLVILNNTIESPYSVAEEADGKILVADPNQTSILRMNADGTNAVNVGSGFNYPSKVLVQADGKILVLDQENKAVKRMNADGTNIEILKNDFSLPQDMNLDTAGAIYVADTNTNNIIKIGATTKTNRVPVVVNFFTNDDCNGAITLNVGSNFDTNAVEVDLSLATASSTIPNPTCGNYQGADVWYKVLVPSSGELNIKTGNLTGENAVNTAMALYSGDCNGFTLLGCNDDESPTTITSSIVLSNLSSGATLYLRVWKNSANAIVKLKENTSTSKTASSKFTISAFTNATLSNDDFKTVDYVIYPNPTSGELTIDATNLTNPLLSVFDLNGKLILNEKLQEDKNALNFSTLSNGVYLFKIKSQEGETVKKVIKK